MNDLILAGREPNHYVTSEILYVIFLIAHVYILQYGYHNMVYTSRYQNSQGLQMGTVSATASIMSTQDCWAASLPCLIIKTSLFSNFEVIL